MIASHSFHRCGSSTLVILIVVAGTATCVANDPTVTEIPKGYRCFINHDPYDCFAQLLAVLRLHAPPPSGLARLLRQLQQLRAAALPLCQAHEPLESFFYELHTYGPNVPSVPEYDFLYERA